MTSDWAMNEYNQIDKLECSQDGKLLLRLIVQVEDFKLENPNLTFEEIKETILKQFPAESRIPFPTECKICNHTKSHHYIRQNGLEYCYQCPGDNFHKFEALQ